MRKDDFPPDQIGQPPNPNLYAARILQCLVDGPLLVTALPEADPFNHRRFQLPKTPPDLNFKQKLGHLYEEALSHLITATPSLQLLERNLQIQQDRHSTLGELDFLVRDLENNSLVHLELATKFYLSVRTADDHILPGPDARDNYFRKLARLRSHQLKLPSKYPQHLPTQYHGQRIESRHLIYGSLFDHIDDPAPAEPSFINPNACRGKWLTINELTEHLPSAQLLKTIPKPLWPVSPIHLQSFPLESFSPSSTLDRCTMALDPTSLITYFVTPSDYPHHKQDTGKQG